MVLSQTAIVLSELRKQPSIKAFLDLIAYAEGTDRSDGYLTIYGVYNKATNLEDHPGKVFCEKYHGKKLCSSAAGRYQFLHSTWDELAKKHNFQDFGPANQDMAAIALLQNVNAIEDIKNKRIDDAIRKSCRIWASLPGSPYGQPTHPLTVLLNIFDERYSYYTKETKT